jgi:hypothetical protein
MRSLEMLATIKSPALVAVAPGTRRRCIRFLAQANDPNGGDQKQHHPASRHQKDAPKTEIPFHSSSPPMNGSPIERHALTLWAVQATPLLVDPLSVARVIVIIGFYRSCRLVRFTRASIGSAFSPIWNRTMRHAFILAQKLLCEEGEQAFSHVKKGPIMTPSDSPYRLPAKFVPLFQGLVLVGGAVFLTAALLGDPRTWANLLLASSYLLGLGLAGAVLVALFYVTGAGWAVALRRVPEAMIGLLLRPR